MVKPTTTIVQKIRSPSSSPDDRSPQHFPKMDNLHLDIIENKNKIDIEKVNTEYVDDPELDQRSPIKYSHEVDKDSETNLNIDNIANKYINIHKSDDSEQDERSPIEHMRSRLSDRYIDRSRNNSEDLLKELDTKPLSHQRSPYPEPPSHQRSPYPEPPSHQNSNYPNGQVDSHLNQQDLDDETPHQNRQDDDNISERLKELLDGDDKDDVSSRASNNSDEIRKSPKRYTQSLRDLENEGKPKHMPNIDNHPTSQTIDDDDAKRELLFKFELLKKSYKDADVPNFNIHTDYKTMNDTYQNTVRRLSLDSSVESYKTYLIGGFMLVEFIFGKFLKLDMQGFTNQQMMNMSSYEKLLIELGEKSYMPDGPSWPVEVRLLFLVLMNSAIFIVSKMIMNKTGSNIMQMMNNLNKKPNNKPQKKRKMQSPGVDIDELLDLDELK